MTDYTELAEYMQHSEIMGQYADEVVWVNGYPILGVNAGIVKRDNQVLFQIAVACLGRGMIGDWAAYMGEYGEISEENIGETAANGQKLSEDEAIELFPYLDHLTYRR